MYSRGIPQRYAPMRHPGPGSVCPDRVVLTGFGRTSEAYPIGPAERTALQGNDAVGGADRFQTVRDHDPGNVERGQRPVHLALLFHIQMRSSLIHEQDARL